ncbi:helix-turn-helix DNA-binding domain protein [Arthrobacter phage Kepler]|uniref:Helix-turn-helix DNA-binding domain protein n=3 Tax=Coralvirus TaxID=2733171 RepID=A0A5J6TQP9_9CAUD|nr:helix-turn-helix DNA binding domain protein [Arthrobacter phage Kepler]AYN58268.1 helix-turn-helix DNA-binding domain protein [Arthrobacter phage Kepler]AYN58588.1 helix-turn-helix DNA-binding domain protein [Arthrobacter phage Melons]QFG13091.1 helix-turn-helix DNA-binding domain protein [Arthrobacter phage Amelia]
MSGWVGLEQLMTAEDVAAVLQVPSTKTVARLRQQGRLRALKVGRGYRFDRRDVEDFIETLRTEQGEQA